MTSNVLTQLVTALITFGITFPMSIVIGYYLSKSLAAPKLSIEYITPTVQTEPLVLEKTTVQQLILHTFGPPSFWPTHGYYDIQCADEIRTSLSLDCAKYLRTNLQDNLKALSAKRIEINDDIQALSVRDGKKPLSQRALYLLGGPGIEFALLRFSEKDRWITVLRERAKDYNDTIQLDTALLGEINSLLSKKPQRTAIIFKIGILNSGDSDGVMSPTATLSFLENIKVRLVNESGSGSFEVVHAHSFVELRMDVDEIKTPLEDQRSLQSAIQHEAQDRFTITVLPAGSPSISAEGNLPG